MNRIKPIYVLAAMLIVATLYFYQDPQSNGNSRLDATKAIVERGSFQIDSYQEHGNWATLDKAYYGGHYYTTKGIGVSLLAVPAYFILYRLAGLLGLVLSDPFVKHFLTVLVIGTAFVLNGLIVYWIAREMTENRWKALVATLGISLGTMLWPYSAVYYAHVPAALFISIAFYLLLRMRKEPQNASMRRFFWAGLAMGAAFITDYTTALIIAVLMVYAIFLLHGQRRGVLVKSGLAGAAGALLVLSIMFAYNAMVYGNILAFGYSYAADPLFHQGRTAGFFGVSLPDLTALYHITIDPQFGVFWQSPVLIMAIVGAVAAFKARSFRAEVLLSIYAFVSIALMNSGTFMWWGGSSFGPRYLIVALPLLVIPLVLVPDRLVWLLTSLTVLSTGQMLIPLLGKIQIGLDYSAANNQFSVNQPFNGFSILYQYGIPIIFKLHSKDTLPWTLGSAIGLPYRFSAALLVGIEAALGALLYRVGRVKPERPSG